MKITIGCLLAISIIQLKAQNLVPNPGFELFSECPTKIGELHKATHWFSSNPGTPEYFRDGCPFYMTNPHSGLGQAGVIMFGDYSKTLEYIETKLSRPLNKGKLHCLEFFIKADDSFMYIDQIGMLLSKEKIKEVQWKPILAEPQLTSKKDFPITKELGWIAVSKEFYAEGGEEFVTIGNFFEDDRHMVHLNEFVSSYSPGWNTYFFVDDVRVEELQEGQTCAQLNPIEIQEIPITKKVFNHTVYFATDSWNLSVDESKNFDIFLDTVEVKKPFRIKLEGFTDKVGDENYNLELSKKRIETVSPRLKHILHTENWELSPKGETYSLNEIDSSERKVEITIIEIN